MKPGSLLQRALGNETVNFVLTNAFPRSAVTRLFGRFSRIEHPWVRDASIALWKRFARLNLQEARKATFASLHDCFIRELKDGARPVDRRNEILTSPCDAVVGACGTIVDATLLQAKGRTYPLVQLLLSPERTKALAGGTYVTLRLTSSMYHRFHAPHDGRITRITYLPGDVWNVNPPTLQRVERVFCRNERAVLDFVLDQGGHHVSLVPVAAVLVASIRLSFIDVRLHLDYGGPREIACDHAFGKGDELGWFEHGSTIIVLAPARFERAPGIEAGTRIRMGDALLRLPRE